MGLWKSTGLGTMLSALENISKLENDISKTENKLNSDKSYSYKVYKENYDKLTEFEMTRDNLLKKVFNK